MATEKQNREPEYIDGWGNPEIIKAMAKSKVTRSQCGACKNKIGTHACKIFGRRPSQYSDPLAKVQCPERKEK